MWRKRRNSVQTDEETAQVINSIKWAITTYCKTGWTTSFTESFWFHVKAAAGRYLHAAVRFAIGHHIHVNTFSAFTHTSHLQNYTMDASLISSSSSSSRAYVMSGDGYRRWMITDEQDGRTHRRTIANWWAAELNVSFQQTTNCSQCVIDKGLTARRTALTKRHFIVTTGAAV